MSSSRGKSANDFPGPLKRIKLKAKNVKWRDGCFVSCTLLKWALATWPPHSKSELKRVIIIYRVVVRWSITKKDVPFVCYLNTICRAGQWTFTWYFTWCWGWHCKSALLRRSSQAFVSNLKFVQYCWPWFSLPFQNRTNLLCWTKSCTSSDKLFTIFNTSSAGWNWMMLRNSYKKGHR